MIERPWRLHLGTCATAAGPVFLTQHQPSVMTTATRRLLILPPLFEEMNRCRALLAALGRELATRNIVSLLPDLPGTGECPRRLENISWTDWLDAVQALVDAEKPDHIFTLRGGALLAQHLPNARDDFAAIASGQSIWRALARARMVMEQEAGIKVSQADLEAQSAQGHIVMCAGYALSPAMLQGLIKAQIRTPACHSWHLGEDDLEGPPVWLQADPLPAPALAQRLADLLQHSMI